MNKLSNKKMVLLLVAMSGTAFAWTPHDSTNDWNVASGNASVAANFNPASAPGANTLVRISNGGEMTVDSDLSWGALWVGRSGTGTVHQSSGELTLNNAGNAEGDGTLWLGYSAADMGLYHLSGGILDIQNGNPQIGRNGGGVLDVSGGEVQIAAPYPSVGRINGGHGFVDVHGTGVFDSTAAQQTTVGEGGLGVVSVRDGGEVRAGRIVLGSASSTGRGMVNVSSGGTLSAKVVAGGAGSFKKINASGGTVKPNTVAAVVTNYMEGVQTTVGAGGLAFDTDGRAVTLRSAVSPSRLVTGNLAHRWSFNGGLADSVGGMDASLVGTRTAGATYAGGEIRLPGAGAWTAAVNLGAGCIPSGRDGITIEIWATQLEYRNWSRLFTADGDDSRMYLAWAWGSNMAQDCFYLKTSGTVRDNNVSRLPSWTHGFKFHVTFVFEKQGDGSWGIRICKRNALTGGPIAQYETTVPGTWDPADIATKYFYLGRSSDANEDACASYDEVRIWNVALNESELIESTVRGPDADFSSAPCFRKTGAGTLTLASAADYAGATRVAAGALALCAPEMPVHRWSFENGSIADVNTGAEAVRVGGASSGIAATADGKGLSFPGASHNGAYMKLGKGNIPAGDRGFTFEVWATLLGLRTWERIFTIATDDISDACFMTWVGGGGTDNTKDYVGFRFNNGSMTTSGNKLAPYNIGQPYHVAVVVLPKDGGWVVRFYKQNATTGELENWYGWALPSGWTPDRFTNANISVAWSSDNGNDDANARYDEIRVWNRAFTEDEIVASGRLGPDVLPVFAYAEGAAGALPASTELTVDSDASFMLGGASQTVAALAGEGTVEGPGTLAVTGAIRPGGNSAVGTLTVKGGARLSGTAELDLMPDGTCDRIDFAPGGTYDISGIHWTVSNVAATASCNSFIVANASGATLTGEIDASGLPANHVIKQTRDGNLVFKRIKGTMLIVQ